jgi:hypothetical protein
MGIFYSAGHPVFGRSTVQLHYELYFHVKKRQAPVGLPNRALPEAILHLVAVKLRGWTGVVFVRFRFMEGS